MGINFGGIAAAYRGFKEDQLQQADEARRAKVDARADQDHAFQEEARSRNRKEWKKTDDIESRKQADIAAIAAESDEEGKAAEAAQDSQSDANFKASLVDAEEQGAPYIGEAKGIPKPIKFNDTLSRQQKLLQRQLSRADIDPAAYAAANESINKMQKEGVNDALELFAQGRYQEGLDKFNSTGSYRGSRLLSARKGETDLGGVKAPTHFVTVTGADGRPIEIDTAKDQFQLALSLKDRLAHTDNVLKTNAQIKHYADTAKHGEVQLRISQQQADTQERYRADQATNMREQRRLQELSAASGAASGAARAPIWDKDADKRIEDLYTSKDPNTGENSVDTSGALFAKRAGLYISYANGGDTFIAANKAKDQDNKMKLAAGGDPAKLAALREQYLSILSQSKPAPVSGSAQGNWNEINARSAAQQPDRNVGQLSVLNNELQQEISRGDQADPKNIAALQREIAAVSKNLSTQPSNPSTTQKNKPIIGSVGGVRARDAVESPNSDVEKRIAKRNSDIANMSSLSGTSTSRRQHILEARERDINENLDSKLSQLKPGISKSEAFKIAEWIDDNIDSMTPAQIKKVKAAKQNYSS